MAVGVPDDGARWTAEQVQAVAPDEAALKAAGGESPPRHADGPADPAAVRRRAEQREARVAAGMRELERWLLDQVRDGLSSAAHAGYAHWDGMAARLVDAQAPGAAGMVRRMGTVPAGGPEWPGRLLETYARAWLLARGYAHVDAVDPALAATLRARVGFTVSREEVLRAGTSVRDRWLVVGSRDETDVDGLTVRRACLRGAATGRAALVLSFAMAGQPLDGSLVPGTAVDADLAFYPAALELRALVAKTHDVQTAAEPSYGATREVLAEYAEALASDPWLEAWPVVIGPVTPAAADRGWHLVDDAGRGLPLVTGEHWRLAAVSGGRRVTVGGEWSPSGLRPLTVWTADRMVRL